MCASSAVTLSSGAPHDQLKPQALPRLDGPAGELRVGLHEPLVEEHRGEAGTGAQLVAEPEPQRCSDDERDQLLGLAPALAAEGGVRAEQLPVGAVSLCGDLDVAAHVEQPVPVSQLGDRARVVPAADLGHEPLQVPEPRLHLLLRKLLGGRGGQLAQLAAEQGYVVRCEPT
jgi:hypothetical protein